MWPAVDHIHILGDLRLPGVNGGRAIQTCRATEILRVREGGLQSSTRSLDLLESVGSQGGQESHPVKQRVLWGVYSPIILQGYKPPWVSASSVWFALSM